MFVIVREFFKIKNERPEEYLENYEDALRLLHLQKKYSEQFNQAYRVYSQESIIPQRKLIKSSKRKKRKKRSPKTVFRSIDNEINIAPRSSSKKRRNQAARYDYERLHSKPFDLYGSYRNPKDPIPEINDENLRNTPQKKIRRKRKKSKKRVKSSCKFSLVFNWRCSEYKVKI